MKKVMARLILGADGKLAGIFVGVILSRGGDFFKCGIGIFVLEVVVIEEFVGHQNDAKSLDRICQKFLTRIWFRCCSFVPKGFGKN